MDIAPLHGVRVFISDWRESQRNNAGMPEVHSAPAMVIDARRHARGCVTKSHSVVEMAAGACKDFNGSSDS